MINVSIYNKASYIVGFKVTGHSGFAEHGNDIVCAAVSVLTMTAFNGITEILKLKPKYICKDGHLEMMLSDNLSADLKEDTNLILKTMTLGLKDIASQYPKYVKFKNQEV